MDTYQPIACIDHERPEFAVLRRHRLRLTCRDEHGAERVMEVLPTDVTTRDQAEWLSYRTAQGEDGVMRLDRIVHIEPAG